MFPLFVSLIFRWPKDTWAQHFGGLHLGNFRVKEEDEEDIDRDEGMKEKTHTDQEMEANRCGAATTTGQHDSSWQVSKTLHFIMPLFSQINVIVSILFIFIFVEINITFMSWIIMTIRWMKTTPIYLYPQLKTFQAAWVVCSVSIINYFDHLCITD